FAGFPAAIEDAKAGRNVENKAFEQLRCARCSRLLPERNGPCPACLDRWGALRRIAAYLEPHRTSVAIIVLASVLVSGAGLLPPVITGWIVDRALLPVGNATTAERRSYLALYVLALLMARVASWGAECIHGRRVAAVGAAITAAIRAELFRCLQML